MKFKIGDKVRRIRYNHTNYKVGDIGVVTYVSATFVRLDDKVDEHDCDNLKLVKNVELIVEIY